MKDKFVVSCQYWEWYGDEDHVGEEGHGRHKPKGGHEFIVELDASEAYMCEEELIEKFNKEHNKLDSFTRFEAKEIYPYHTPGEATYDREAGRFKIDKW